MSHCSCYRKQNGEVVVAVAELPVLVHVDFQAFSAQNQNPAHRILVAVLGIRQTAINRIAIHQEVAFHDQLPLTEPPADGIQATAILEVTPLHMDQRHTVQLRRVSGTVVTVVLEIHTHHHRIILEAAITILEHHTEQLQIILAIAIAASALLMDQRQTISVTVIVASEAIIIILPIVQATLVGHRAKLLQLQHKRIQIPVMEPQKCQMQAAALITLDGIPNRAANHHIQHKTNIKITQPIQKHSIRQVHQTLDRNFIIRAMSQVFTHRTFRMHLVHRLLRTLDGK